MSVMFPAGHSFRYSTEEQWTGDYWIDGKKIYRKVIGETNLALNAEITLGTDISTIVDYSFNLKRQDNSWIVPYYFSAGDWAGVYISLYLDNTVALIVRGNNSIYGGVIRGWIEYTKVTD